MDVEKTIEFILQHQANAEVQMAALASSRPKRKPGGRPLKPRRSVRWLRFAS